MIESIIIERNAVILNQVQGTPLTVEPLVSLIGTDSFITFGQELLEENCNTSAIMSSLTLQKYLQKLKINQHYSKHQQKQLYR